MMELSVKGRDPKTGLVKHLATRSFAIFIKGMGFSVNEEGVQDTAIEALRKRLSKRRSSRKFKRTNYT